ncbi:unnamed protein product [Adineta ricciae]|uniref:Uncharacterized protein n=1 Tax=Adineta ricciae TaxID=249248 RepID=A0A813VWJ7_ADIRI|nr:unnamed protein product [Adineta ricciae]CAF1582520.1 unnamed protein product [Adineta ricciae]
MSLSGAKKSPLTAVPYLKKRLRRATAFGFYNLTVDEFNFTVHFTLHRNEKTIAFYTSEAIENQRSPEWSYLKIPPSVQCLQDVFMRVWITSSNHCRLFLEYDIHLDNSLIPDEQKASVNKGNNTLWLEIFGYRFTDNNGEDFTLINSEDIGSSDRKKRNFTTKSYNKLSIIRMNNAIHAIRKDRQSSATYLERLQTFFDEHEDYLSKIKERESRRLRMENLKKYIHSRTYVYQQQINSNQQKQRTLEQRRNELNHNLTRLLVQKEEIQSYQKYLNQSRSILRKITQIIAYRQREIMDEIYRYIYPIHCDAQKEYSIADRRLPQADDKVYQSASSRDRDHEIAAAVGYCSHFVLIIAQFIHLPLRFPIDYHGIPAIKIYDYTLETSEFPLYPTSNLSAFRYGFYLLNRNIGQIMYHCRTGDRNTDFRNTLENLRQIIENYFINASNTNHQIQLYPALQTSTDEEPTDTKRHSRDSSIAYSSFSSTSSLIENDDFNQNDDMDLFPHLNTMKPRLAMQISHQLQY